jgi:hypothetical protein
MIGQHMGGLPELAIALGPLLLIAVFIKIARRAEAAEAADPADADPADEVPADADPVDADPAADARPADGQAVKSREE